MNVRWRNIKAIYAKDIHSYIDDTKVHLAALHKQVQTIQQRIEAVLSLENSFTGRTAASIRSFYQECHVPLLVFLEGFLTTYLDTLDGMKRMLRTLEPDENGVIREDFIDQDIQRGLNMIENVTMSLTDDANRVIQSIQDIVELPMVDDRSFFDTVQHSKKMANEALENLHTFDHQNTSKLAIVEKDLQSMQRYVSKLNQVVIHGEISIPTYRARSITRYNFHLELLSDLRKKAGTSAIAPEVLMGIVGKQLLSQFTPLAGVVGTYLQQAFDVKTLDYSMRAIRAITAASEDVLTKGEFVTLKDQIVSDVEITDYKGEWQGVYYTLADDRKIRAFENAEGTVCYELVSAIPENREQNLFQKTGQSIQEIGSDLWQEMEERKDKSLDSWYNFGNYMTLGAFDAGKDFSNGLSSRAENMLNTPSDFVNWITMGGVDVAQGALHPDEALSKEHLLSSFGLFSIAVGGEAAFTKPKSNDLGPSGKSNHKKVESTSSENRVSTATPPKLPTLTNIKEWYRTHLPEVTVVSDTTGGYHFAVKQGEGGGNKGTGKSNLEVQFTKEQLATKPSYSPAPDKWTKKGGTVKIDEDGTWIYTNKRGQTVRYPDGYPDFTEYAHPTVKPVEIEIASPTNRPLDYKNANKKAGLNKDSDPPVASLNEAPEGYTWHHHQDGKTMILVDKKVHREFTHAGGISIVNGI
ncbi:T7SS effector LXG polymorphic toxin [Virgibacillus salexigens]|uniref:T7SS effector LXG polymorphic toxin n=1 Tax=Virgibacillus salexigens TaxID=61016 RepID=UPI00190BE353|nr:T7SS effector LXG polymorphic toxin [Virgibacillus salexigens]